MSNQNIDQPTEPEEALRLRGRDIVWALGMCAVSLGLTPVAAFYMLLVA